MVPRPRLEHHGFFPPHCCCLAYRHNLHLSHWHCISSLSSSMLPTHFMTPPVDLSLFSPSLLRPEGRQEIPGGTPQNFMTLLKPDFTILTVPGYIYNPSFHISSSSCSYSSMESTGIAAPLVPPMAFNNSLHVLAIMDLSGYVFSCSNLALQLFTTTDYLHSIYLIIHICTILHQCQPNAIQV
jgi:hypothetical protein